MGEGWTLSENSEQVRQWGSSEVPKQRKRAQRKAHKSSTINGMKTAQRQKCLWAVFAYWYLIGSFLLEVYLCYT